MVRESIIPRLSCRIASFFQRLEVIEAATRAGRPPGAEPHSVPPLSQCLLNAPGLLAKHSKHCDLEASCLMSLLNRVAECGG